MFYGSGRVPDSPGGGNRGAPGGVGPLRNRAERFDQMTKQEQLIEQKRREIEAKLAAERQRKELEAIMAQEQSNALGQSSSGVTTSSAARPPDSKQSSVPAAKLAFANDGSFMEQFKKLQEQRQKEKEEVKIKEEHFDDVDEYGGSTVKKPSFKLINPVASSVSRNSARQDSDSDTKQIKHNRNDVYSAPPPPPPPASDVVKQSHRGFNQHNQQRSHAAYQACPPPPPPPPPPPAIISPSNFAAWQPPPQVKAFALAVADGGDEVEERARNLKSDDPLMWFLYRPDSREYQSYRDLVIQIRNEKSFNATVGVPPPPPPPPSQSYQEDKLRAQTDQDMRLLIPKRTGGSGNSSEEDDKDGSKKKRSRWGPQSAAVVQPPGLTSPLMPPILAQAGVLPPGQAFTNQPPIPQMFAQSPGTSLGIGVRPAGPNPILTKVIRTNPQLLSYARQSYGTVNLDEEQWKQCEEAYKMNLLFQDIARKKARDEKLAQSGKFKHEYDSDEEVDDDGTWEHKMRLKEMEKTKEIAQQLTEQAKGKHHIGDFLPPEELDKFMNKYKAVKEGRQMDESAYQDFKIAQDNVGFKLLQKMGWSDGQGLGASGQGITVPIDKGGGVNDKQGLGVEKPSDISEEDDEYAAYRKRMMLAYRFRPNPLNNPRRAYY